MTQLHKISAVAAVLLAAGLCGNAAAQYRWTDASGKVHYGDAPPRDAKDVRALNGRASVGMAAKENNVQLPYELRRAVERAPVVLYTAPECQPCVPAAALLRERGVPFDERTVVSPEDVQEFRRVSGGLRLPYVAVGSQSQSGFSPDSWLSLLDAAGYPKGSMLPRSYQWPKAQPLVAPRAETKQAAAEAGTPQPPATEQAAAPVPAKK